MSKYLGVNFIVDSSAAFLRNTTFNSSTYLNVTNEATGGTYYALTTTGTGASQLIKYKQLGTMAFEASINYVGVNAFNSSIGEIDNRLSIIDSSIIQLNASINAAFLKNINQDSSITALDILTQRFDGSINALFAHDAQDVTKAYVDGSLASRDVSIANLALDITNIETSLGTLNGLINTNTTHIINIESSLGVLNNWNISQDASIFNITNNYVKKAGDTMTGALTISSGGLDVTNNVSIGGNLFVNSDLYVKGDFTVDGSVTYINTQTLNVSDNFISVNYGMTGTPPVTLQSGIKVNRGSEDPYVFMFDETNDTFRIGIAEDIGGGSFNDASTQAVATREDNPLASGVAVWNSSLYRFDSKILTAGNGITITQTDTSIVVAVTGASSMASKYKSTFDGTSGSSITVTAATHGLGVGPFIVNVYDTNVMVFPDISQNGSGDVTISWVPGSLSSTCSYIIIG